MVKSASLKEKASSAANSDHSLTRALALIFSHELAFSLGSDLKIPSVFLPMLFSIFY